jgi:polyisoprenoid-binding protein YceI
MNNVLFPIFVVISVFLSFGDISAEEFYVDTLQNNSVKFFAKATLGNFTGETKQISGSMSVNVEDTLASGNVDLYVDLASLDTGNGRRNRHMREKYLETDLYPKAHYRGEIVNWAAENDSIFDVATEGTIVIHGVEKSLMEKVKIFKKGELYLVFLNFQLDITDFGIKKPRFLISSMNKVVNVQLKFHFKPSNDIQK